MNIAGTSGIGGAAFSGYKLVTVGTSEQTIRVPVALPMSERPYRKAMVTNFFFRKIKALAVDSVFISANLVSTIAAYFNFNTSPAEDEATAAAETIHDSVFYVGNLTGLGFQNQLGAAVLFDVTAERPANLRYFDFRSSFRASDIDSRGLTNLFSVDFMLKLPQNTVAASAPLLSNIASPTITSPTTFTTNNMTMAADKLTTLRFELGNLREDHVATLGAKYMRSLL